MGNVLKSSRYRIVDNRAFEMPLPLKFTVLMEDAQICSYLVDEEERVSYDIITKYKEQMLTTIQRPLNISDIYYLFSCRVFQDRTPFTYPILDRMGLDKYNVYNILTRTHGISPYDEYWIRFDGEKLNYEQALKQFKEYVIDAEAQPAETHAMAAPGVQIGNIPAPAETEKKPNVSAILNQNKVDVEALTAGSHRPVCIAPDESYAPAMELENNKMSEDEIEKLLHSVGIDDEDENDTHADGSAPDIAIGDAEAVAVDGSSRSEEYSEPSGGKMSQEDIEKLLTASAPAEPEPAPAPAEPSGGKMSQEDIEKLLAANAPAEPEPAPAPAEPSVGKMSQEDIEKLLAASAPAEPAPEPAEPSGGKMSQEDIEKLLAASAPAEPEPAPEPAEPSGGKMSQEDIEKLLAASAPAEPAPEPAEPSGGKMSQEDIEKLLAASAPAEPEPAPAEPESAPAPAEPSGGKMSQEDIEKLLAASAPAEPEPAPAPAPAKSAGRKSSHRDTKKALLERLAPGASSAKAESSPADGKMSHTDIEKAYMERLAPASAETEPEKNEPEKVPETSPAGGKMSQDDIEALLSSMQEEANK